MPLQLRRGNTAEVNSITPLIGEIVYDTQLKRILVGDGSTVGGTPVAGVTTAEAKDAAAASLLAGTHQNIEFTYNSTTKALSAKVDILVHDTIVADAIDTGAVKDGSTVVLNVATATLNGNVNGNINGVVTGIAGSTLIGNVTGNLTGNSTGYHTGDIKGSVFADDSSILVDAVDSIHYGDFVGGDISGNIITNLISSNNSSPIQFDTEVQFQTRVNLEDDLVLTKGGTLQIISDYIDDNFQFSSHADDDFPSSIILRRSRGTNAAPTVVQTDDRLSQINWNAFDGTNYITAAAIQARVTGSVAAGIVPTSLRFFVNDTLGDEVEAMTITRFGNVDINRTLGINAPDGETNFTNLRFFTHHTSGTDSCNLAFNRGRGTLSAPTAVQTGDVIYDMQFVGHDGTSYSFSSQIRGVVIGTVSTGVVQGRLDFRMRNASGSVTTAAQIEASKSVFNNMLQIATFTDEATANTAVGTPVNGMMYYDSTAGKIKGYQGGAWVILQP